MKKFVLAAIILLSFKQSDACDICGCSSGNYFIGPFPQFRQHFFGTRYTFKRYTSHVADDHSEFSKDLYQTAELWGGMNVGKKWQEMAFVPFNINRQISDDGVRKNIGLGDITIISNYKLIDTRSGDGKGKRLSQQFWVGGGIKLPTGRFAAEKDEIIPGANNEPGTGSLDFLVNAMYSFHINDWGLNSNATYKMNGRADNFQFGNRTDVSTFLFRSFYAAKTSINPNMGLLFEHLQANKLNTSKINDTGGNALLVSAGAETIFNKVVFGFNAQLPVSENMSNRQTKTNVRGMIHVTFVF